MEPIDPQALTAVRGGFAALLGALLQAAPGIIQAVGGLTKGSGTAAPAQGQPTMAAPTMAAPTMSAPGGSAPTTQMASADPSGGATRSWCDPIGASSVTNIIRIG